MLKSTPQTQFRERWNNSTTQQREEILRGIKWKPGQFTRGFYDDNDIREMARLTIHGQETPMNGTVAEFLVERAVPKPGILEKFSSFLPGQRK